MRDFASVSLAAEARRAIEDHAAHEAPREAVGLVAGPAPSQITQTRALINVAGPLAFFAEPYSQFTAEKSLRDAGLQVLGYYHSHPGGGVTLSAEDRHFATRTDWTYLVISTGWNGEPPHRITAWRRTPEGDFAAVPLD